MIINFKCTYELFGCAGEKKYNSGYRNWQEKSIFIFMEKKEILPNEIHKKQCLVKNIPISVDYANLFLTSAVFQKYELIQNLLFKLRRITLIPIDLMGVLPILKVLLEYVLL